MLSGVCRAGVYPGSRGKAEMTKAVIADCFLCSHSGLNQGPPDYESGALTN